MAGPRQPIELIVAKGKKHLTQREIADRLASEPRPCTDDLTPPPYLTAAQKKQFVKLCEQLKKIGIMGETDVDALARYVTAQGLYEQAVKDLRKVQAARPKEATAEQLMAWAAALEKLDKRTERYFKQATAAARSLGLDISSRCKLIVPKAEDDKPKVNKFSAFEKAAR